MEYNHREEYKISICKKQATWTFNFYEKESKKNENGVSSFFLSRKSFPQLRLPMAIVRASY